MRRLLIAAAVLVLAACGDSSPEPNGSDVLDTGSELPGKARWIEVENPGAGEYGRDLTYWCLYLYVDNGYDGGPALWCDSQQPQEVIG